MQRAAARWLWLVPVAGYGFAWIGHYVFEKNRPATFKHPLYSLLGDWVMYGQMLRGKVQLLSRSAQRYCWWQLLQASSIGLITAGQRGAVGRCGLQCLLQAGLQFAGVVGEGFFVDAEHRHDIGGGGLQALQVVLDAAPRRTVWPSAHGPAHPCGSPWYASPPWASDCARPAHSSR